MCAENKNVDRALQALQYYRQKFPQFKLSINLYNVVLGGYAENANLHKVKEVLNILKKDQIQHNSQSYAFVFETLGRLGDYKGISNLLKQLHDDASANVIFFVFVLHSRIGLH